MRKGEGVTKVGNGGWKELGGSRRHARVRSPRFQISNLTVSHVGLEVSGT